jgi:hypothetical protein
LAGRADGGEGRCGGEPGACGYVKDAHARRKMGGTQQEGHEVRRDMRESTIVLCRRLILEGEFLRHPRLLFLALGLEGMFSTTRWLGARSANPPCTLVQMRIPAMSQMGHEERFPRTRLSVGCGFRKETIAGMRRNGRDAP